MEGKLRTSRQDAVKADQMFVNQADELLERVRLVGHSIEGKTQQVIHQSDNPAKSNEAHSTSA